MATALDESSAGALEIGGFHELWSNILKGGLYRELYRGLL